MATIQHTLSALSTLNDNVHVVVWADMTKTTDDVGTAVEMPGSADRSVQVTGTFGSGGSCRIEGSNDGTNYVVLTDPQGNALNLTAATIEAISELTRYIRPRVTAGDVNTSLTVTMLVKRG